MIRIELDEPTLARTRIATSPLWEVTCGLSLLRRNPAEVPWPYTEPGTVVQAAVATEVAGPPGVGPPPA